MSLTRKALFRVASSDRFAATVLAIPPARAPAYRAALRYVAGRTLDDAFAVARRLHGAGEAVIRPSAWGPPGSLSPLKLAPNWRARLTAVKSPEQAVSGRPTSVYRA